MSDRPWPRVGLDIVPMESFRDARTDPWALVERRQSHPEDLIALEVLKPNLEYRVARAMLKQAMELSGLPRMKPTRS